MEYELNIAKVTKEYPNGLHWALVKFGRVSRQDAQMKADMIIALMGRDGFHYTMYEHPTATCTSWVV